MQKSNPDEAAIVVKDLRKSFGELKVLNGISFRVKPGTILALLGPNGAGKTTTIRILSTLLKPDSGSASIAGYNVLTQPSNVKGSIGLTGQYAAVDEYLTGEENLLMIGRLYRLSKQDCQLRTKELLKLFDLVKPGTRRVKTYSGGMRRRLDLAMSLIASPPIIFLDEPTTGLDPRSRLAMWDMIKQLTAMGTTILLTTQYMDEADQLADNIVVLDNGKVIAEGSSDTLKKRVGSDRIEIIISSRSNFDKAASLLKTEKIQTDSARRSISLASTGGTAKFRQISKQLEDAGIVIESFALHRPTLDDVFLSLTGHATVKEVAEPKAPKKGGNK